MNQQLQICKFDDGLWNHILCPIYLFGRFILVLHVAMCVVTWPYEDCKKQLKLLNHVYESKEYLIHLLSPNRIMTSINREHGAELDS